MLCYSRTGKGKSGDLSKNRNPGANDRIFPAHELGRADSAGGFKPISLEYFFTAVP